MEHESQEIGGKCHKCHESGNAFAVLLQSLLNGSATNADEIRTSGDAAPSVAPPAGSGGISSPGKCHGNPPQMPLVPKEVLSGGAGGASNPIPEPLPASLFSPPPGPLAGPGREPWREDPALNELLAADPFREHHRTFTRLMCGATDAPIQDVKTWEVEYHKAFTARDAAAVKSLFRTMQGSQTSRRAKGPTARR